VVEPAAAELSVANEVPTPSSWVAAAAIAAGAVVTNDMYFSWVARSRPRQRDRPTVVSVSVCWYPAAVPRVYLGVT
jgi:hypothetical protein